MEASGDSPFLNLLIRRSLNEIAPPRQLVCYMASDEHRRARIIQASIHDILLRDWDPIGVNDVPGAHDEYDSFVGGAYRLLASNCSIDEIVDYFVMIESQRMGLSVQNRERLATIAKQLVALDVSL